MNKILFSLVLDLRKSFLLFQINELLRISQFLSVSTESAKTNGLNSSSLDSSFGKFLYIWFV